MLHSAEHINLFQANVPFLYPLKTSEDQHPASHHPHQGHFKNMKPLQLSSFFLINKQNHRLSAVAFHLV